MKGNLLLMEGDQPLCLTCAGFEDLVFLPSGNSTLTRRAKKYSTESAVVVKFSRSRKRYERQGILVQKKALQKAQEE
ncbi:MAG: hypothetical protein BGO67_10390 [Alphaproteobacteria bacterium 41-28]|nr:MAG: hypothetical protein BGO67_10390 [Alphaproteobacteria bacterium 41-28]